MTNSILSANTAEFNGGAIANDGTLAVSGSTLTANTAPSGGAIHNEGEGATVTVAASTLSGNTAQVGGGITNDGTLAVTGSTLSGNSADFGGGVYNLGGTLTVTNSTLAGNTAGHGGGVANSATLTVTNSTLSGKSALDTGGGAGGGIHNLGAATVRNMIVAGNQATSTTDNCSGELSPDSTHNLSDTDECGPDFVVGDPGLGPLTDNGGPTATMALAPGSPAIDAGDDAVCPPVDQRGVARPQDGNGDGAPVCDIGAYEAAPADLVVTKTADPATVARGQQLTYTITVANQGPGPAQDVVVSDDLPAATGFQQVPASQGTCTPPQAGEAGTLTCALGSLATGAQATLTLVVTVAATATGTIANTATAASATTDPDPDSNRATASTPLASPVSSPSDPPPPP